MALVNMKEMLAAARKARKAVGAFNITNYETAAAVLKVEEALRRQRQDERAVRLGFLPAARVRRRSVCRISSARSRQHAAYRHAAAISLSVLTFSLPYLTSWVFA